MTADSAGEPVLEPAGVAPPVHAGGRIALVLGAGGARGLAHIGVLEELRARGFEVAGITGVSMGAVVAGVHAAGKLEPFKEWTSSLGRRQVLRLLDFAFGFPGLIRGDRIMRRLHDLVGDRTIESLPMPYVAVATDLARMREVWLTHGSLFDAMRASMAIPMIFTPHTVNGRELVDGGLMTPLPISATRQMHVDRVIAVDVNAPVPWEHPWLPHRPEEDRVPTLPDAAPVPRGMRERIAALWDGPDVDRKKSPAGSRGVMDLMARSFDTMQARMTRLQIAQDPPDLLIQVPGDAAMFHEYWRAAELIEIGRNATRKALDSAGL